MRISRRNFPGSSAGWLGSRCLEVLATPPTAPLRFRDIASSAGLATVPRSSSKRRYLVETMGGGGIALFDYDNDGKLDIAVVNDSTIEQFFRGGDPMITLYHLDSDSGNIHFTDVTQSAGLTTRGWGNAIAVGDYENDGLPDLCVTGYGHNVLYHNLAAANSRTSPGRRDSKSVGSAPVRLGLTTTETEILTCS